MATQKDAVLPAIHAYLTLGLREERERERGRGKEGDRGREREGERGGRMRGERKVKLKITLGSRKFNVILNSLHHFS